MLTNLYLALFCISMVTTQEMHERIVLENIEVLDIAKVRIRKHRLKRDTEAFETLNIESSKLNSGNELELLLRVNQDLVVSNIEWRSKQRKLGSATGSHNVECNFLSGVAGSSASLVQCGDRVSGVIKHPNSGSPIFIEPCKNSSGDHILYHARSKEFDAKNDQEYARKRTKRLAFRVNVTEVSSMKDWSDDEMGSSGEHGSGSSGESELDDVGYFLDKLWEQETISQWQPLKKISSPRWLKLALTVDHSVIAFHGRENVQLYVLSLMNIVSAVYKDPSLDSNLKLAIVKLLFLEDEEDCKVVEGSSKESLESVNRWSEVEDAGAVRDAAVWLTKVDLGGPSGYAPVSGVCDPARSCTLNRDEGLTSAFIIAHELGHVLGLSHDGDLAMGNNCTDEAQKGSIMAAMVSATFHRFHWSQCSYTEFHTKANEWGCLSARPYGSEATLLSSLVNASFSMDEQCRMEFGDGFSLCQSFDLPMPCSYLWCSHQSSQQLCRTKKGPPLEGTECGPNHWCVGGHCEETDPDVPLDPVLHNARDGVWSPWSAWQPCSRTCGFGASFRTRRCDSPKPKYGGSNCVGRSEEFKICAHKPCPQPIKDFRAQQCSFISNTHETKYGPMKNQNKTKELWLPIEVADKKLQCQLICVNKNTGKQLRTSENLVDGTPCSYEQPGQDICIQGVCQELGCDGQVDSPLRADLCGECGGNSSQCHNVTLAVNKLIRRPLTKVLVFPKLARYLHVVITLSAKAGNLQPGTDVLLQTRTKDEFRLQLKPTVVEGARFHLSKEHMKWTVSARGPLLSELVLLVASPHKGQRVRLLSEISYVLHTDEYLKRGDYFWVVGGWGPCQGMRQQRTFGCRQGSTGKLVPHKFCPVLSRPSHSPTRSCKTTNFYWAADPWEHCPTTCGSKGQQRREVSCKSLNASTVHPSFCDHEVQPMTTQACNRVACEVQWDVDSWTQCSASCGAGLVHRKIRCLAPRGEPLYQCAEAPLQTKACHAAECTETCRNHSLFCALPALRRYCALPFFQQLCCAGCFH